MRIKKFTLLTLALVMSVVAFAKQTEQNVLPSQKKQLTLKQQILRAEREGKQLNKETIAQFKFNKPATSQFVKKQKRIFNLPVKKLDATSPKTKASFLQVPGKAKAPRKAGTQSYEYHFITSMNGWTEIDADGDGETWYILKSSSISGHDGETGLMTSASYAGSALTPDNYLVSPKMKLDGKITFWASGQDASWAAEHFGVAVSTASGTDPDDFTTIQEWTMSAAPSLAPSANFNAPAGAFRSPQRVQGNWYQYTYDLSSYAGAEGYVAIRHFDCTDMFRLNVDDITLETSELLDPYDPALEVVPDLVELPTGATVTPYYTIDGTLAVYTSSGWSDYTNKVKNINVAFVGADVYIQGLAYGQQNNWVKGTLSGNVITVPSGQYVGGGEYLNGMANDGSWLENYTFTVDTEAGTIACEGYIGESEYPTTNSLSCYWIAPVFSVTAPEDPRVTPPDGLVTETWTFAGYFYDGEDDTPTEKTLQIGFDGNDVYVQGIGNYMPEAWIKGTLSADGNSITFASGQYYGAYDDTYDLWFAVGDEDFNYLESVTVAYDAVAGTITWPEDIYIFENGAADEISAYGLYYDILIVRGTAPDPLEAPSGLETTEWQFTGLTMDEESNLVEYKIPVFVGFDGTDVWVKGLCEDLPDTWIKGTMSGNTVTFPTGQHFGTYVYWFWEFEYFFAGYGDSGYEDVVMNYDAAAKTLTMTSPNFLLINAYWLLLDPNLYFLDVQMKEIPDVAATPAQPEITGAKLTGTSYPNVSVNIPLEDEDGNPILSDKLSYQYYYEIDHVQNPLTLTTDLYTRLTEDMTEIPYNFTDSYDVYNDQFYLNMDFSSWNKIGIQSIYRGGGEENRSEIFWYVIAPYMHNATFVAADEFSIQNGNATVKVDDNKIDVDSEGKAEIPEASTVTLNAAKGYVFVSATSSDATVTIAEDGLSASFEMPEKDVTVNYQVRELGKDIQFTSTNEFSIQGGQADLDINGDIVDLDANGLITDVAKGSTITLTADPAFKFTNVQATYTETVIGPDPIINYVLTDSYGDGWTGGKIEIVNVSTSDVVATLTIESGASAEGSIELEPGSYEINYTEGSYAYENSFVITDTEGNVIASGTGSEGSRTLTIYTVSPAPDPVDLDYTLASNGSTITFTVPNGNVSLTYTLEHRGVPVTIPAGKYVTYYSNEGTIVFDEGVQLMTVVSITDKTVNVEACDAIPALTPMLIYNSNGADTEAWIVSTDELGMTISNTVTVCDEFKGTLTEKTFTEDDMAAKDYYICTGQDFVWVPNAGSIAANKCWIELSKDQPQSTRAIVIGDETTGIAGVSNKVVDGQWYDLNGRKLEQKPTAKGVYIVNGKKQVIK